MKTKMTWNRIWVRHGWNLKLIKDDRLGTGQHYIYLNETKENFQFLCECLTKAEVAFKFDDCLKILTIKNELMDEEKWLQIVDVEYRGRTETVGIYNETREINLLQLDTYISGVVRQVNRLGIQTEYSCDGHEKRKPFLVMPKGDAAKQLIELLNAIGISCRIGRENRQHDTVNILIPRKNMLELAERLSNVDKDWLTSFDTIEEGLFQAELEKLLSIPGKSGNESEIRNYISKKLMPLVDTMRTDSYGNLLAEKSYGTGRGPVIMLNAHMDIFKELIPGREIVKSNGIWRSSEGILGADDRAGIAILFQIANHLQTTRYNGTVKYILTVEEEIGLIGASEVNPAFLENIDAAFVLDRRGSGDIVTSCAGIEYFCTGAFGSAIEEIAATSSVGEWKCTAGGSSDTRIWATAGIQSVNLSVGYSNEHTNAESLDVWACYNTVRLLKILFLKKRLFMPSVKELQRHQAKMSAEQIS